MTPAAFLTGDSATLLKCLSANHFDCAVTSPPYFGLRDYGVGGQMGLEDTPDLYVKAMVALFREVRRVLRDDGTLWLNLGDTYHNADKWGGGGANTGKHRRTPDGDAASWQAVRRKWSKVEGLKPKDLIGIPWRVAFALQADGWYLRSCIVWDKPNAMPESVRDRPTNSHEYIFLLAKQERYFYNADAIREPHRDVSPARQVRNRSAEHKWTDGPGAQSIAVSTANSLHPNGRNKRSVWSVSTRPFKGAHFATFPPALIEPCILAGSREGGAVLDPFGGAGTTALVARRLGRRSVSIELNPDYVAIARQRLCGAS